VAGSNADRSGGGSSHRKNGVAARDGDAGQPAHGGDRRTTEHGIRLGREIRRDPFLGTRLVGFFDDRDRERLGDLPAGGGLLGNLRELGKFVKENRIDLIYVTLPMATQPRIMALLDDLRDTTASIYFVPDLFVTDLIQGRIANINGMPVVAVCETPFTGMDGIIKRVSDVVLSLLILALISPLMLAVAVGVKQSSPGPVLFKQRRYGADGKEILVYKFRSMTVCEDGERIIQATRNDQRVTRLGLSCARVRSTSCRNSSMCCRDA